jgi:hypothetical protein
LIVEKVAKDGRKLTGLRHVSKACSAACVASLRLLYRPFGAPRARSLVSGHTGNERTPFVSDLHIDLEVRWAIWALGVFAKGMLNVSV